MKYNLFVKGMVLLLSTILIASSCKKDSPPQEQLPPETHTGAYTFGCKVDGKIYTASGKGGLLSNQDMWYNIRASDSSINVGVSNTKEKFNRFATKLDSGTEVKFRFSTEIKLDSKIIKQFTKPFSIINRIKYKLIHLFF